MHRTDRPAQAGPRSRVRLLVPGSGRGLQIDADLLQHVLQDLGYAVDREVLPAWSERRAVRSHRYARIKGLLPGGVRQLLDAGQVGLAALAKRRVALQIHLESIAVDYLGAADANWLIPNQEWIRTQHLGFFGRLDRVLVKTAAGRVAMQALHPAVATVGFSNPVAMALPTVTPGPGRMRRFLHVAGSNRKKGTPAIIEAWRRHPQWPVLHVVLDDTRAYEPLPDNVVAWHRPDAATLDRLRRDNGIVLAPSEVEGYGHVLVEGMAYEQVVVTTDAAPMNELVGDDRGYLLPWSAHEPCHLGTRYFVTADAVEAAVAQILAAPPAELLRRATAGRAWVASNHRAFVAAIRDAMLGAGQVAGTVPATTRQPARARP